MCIRDRPKPWSRSAGAPPQPAEPHQQPPKPRSWSPSTTTPSKTPYAGPGAPWTAPSSHRKPSASSPATQPSSPWSWAAKANPWTSGEPNAWSPQPCWPHCGPETRAAPSPTAGAHPNGAPPTTSSTESTADPPPCSTSPWSVNTTTSGPTPTTSPPPSPHTTSPGTPDRHRHRTLRHLAHLTDPDTTWLGPHRDNWPQVRVSPGPGQPTPTWSIRKASSHAYCLHASYRPLLPPCPATTSILNRIGRCARSLVTVSRRRATPCARP